MTRLETLRQYFGYAQFREGQEALIADIMGGKDVLGIMPTGAGKSICFQIPALMMRGIVLVVSPLISLMKDQVNALTQSGIPAAFINSSLTERQIAKALLNAGAGAYKLIYVAPERLLNQDFLRFAASAQVAMLTVDEAHCISQWGQDFRPSYTAIPDFIARLKHRPVVSAFTATATLLVRDDIINQLALNNPSVLVAGFDRPNLHFDVKRPGDKFAALISFLRERPGDAGIVYCSTRAAVEEVADRLKQGGYSAARYHAGLTDTERTANQNDFLHDRVKIMVATNAFGMGIDKSNVAFVVHYNMPKDIEGYYQEAGRAGRDGQPADCLLLYSGRDVATNMWLIENSAAEHVDEGTSAWLKERSIKRLNEMALYCQTNECLRGYILNYFGENLNEPCGNCANCSGEFEILDITHEAKKILSCVNMMRGRFGAGMVVDVLRGAKNARLRKLGLDRLAVFGTSEITSDGLQEMINHMILTGYLQKTADRYPVLRLGPKAAEATGPNAVISMKAARGKSHDGAKAAPAPAYTKKRRSEVPIDQNLLAALKDLRLTIAREQNLPAFVIFHDSTLADMCAKKPRNLDELLGVSGVGEVKAARYGERFLEAIADRN